MSEHAVLAPSSAFRRRACAGSRALEAAYPELEESPASREGTAAHWCAAELMAGRTIDEGLIAPNGVMVTDEMVEGAEMYVDYMESIWTKFDLGKSRFRKVECRTDISTIHEHCYGTPDLSIMWPRHLFIADFKFGHEFVDAFENWQLIEYAAGELEYYDIDGISDQHTYVTMAIIQPRAYGHGGPIREWTILASDLRGHFNEARRFETEAMKDNAPYTVSDACTYCSGRHVCPAYQQAAQVATQYANTGIPFMLSNQAAAVELRYLKRAQNILEGRISGLEVQLLEAGKRGESIPHWAIEAGQGKEVWKESIPEAEIVAMGELLEKDLTKRKLVTPIQARKILHNDDLVKAYTERRSGALKLVPFDGSKFKKIFIDEAVTK